MYYHNGGFDLTVVCANVTDRAGATSVKLLETACGIIIVRSGNPVPLPSTQCNCFTFEQDPLLLSETDHKPLCTQQKPVKFYKDMLSLYTTEGEWILNGFSGLGEHFVGCGTKALKFQILNIES